MISCPQCKHQELDGALYCSFCGAQLFDNADITASMNALDFQKIQAISTKETPSFPVTPADKKDSQVAIYLIDSGEAIFVDGDTDLTIGRLTEGQLVVPDLDLSPFEAYEAGVSRLHASLSVVGTQVRAKDLGSANGTRINGVKIVAHAEHTVQHGDILTLGKLKIQILIKE